MTFPIMDGINAVSALQASAAEAYNQGTMTVFRGTSEYTDFAQSINYLSGLATGIIRDCNMILSLMPILLVSVTPSYSSATGNTTVSCVSTIPVPEGISIGTIYGVSPSIYNWPNEQLSFPDASDRTKFTYVIYNQNISTSGTIATGSSGMFFSPQLNIDPNQMSSKMKKEAERLMANSSTKVKTE